MSRLIRATKALLFIVLLYYAVVGMAAKHLLIPGMVEKIEAQDIGLIVSSAVVQQQTTELHMCKERAKACVDALMDLSEQANTDARQ